MFKSSRRLLAYAALSLVVLTALNACRDIAQPNSTTTQVAIGGGGRPYRDPSTRGDAQSYTWVINAHPIYGSGTFSPSGVSYPKPTWVKIVANGYFVREPNYPCIGGGGSYGPYGRAGIAWGDGVYNHSQTFWRTLDDPG